MTARRTIIGLLAASLMLTCPFAGRAQPAAPVRRIALLSPSVETATATQQGMVLMREALRRAGYEEGRNLVIEFRFAEGNLDRLPALADELVRLKVELIVAFTNDAIAEARRATRSIPIVMSFGTEPVEAGFIESFARPGGNVTGTVWASSEYMGKVFELLKEAAPATKRVAILVNPIVAAAAGPGFLAAVNRAASTFGIAFLRFPVARADDIAGALDRIAASGADALFVATDAITFAKFGEIAAFALSQKLVTIGTAPQFADSGGLLCCGPDVPELITRTSSYVDRILRGARPADLPVEMPAHFLLTINLRTARAIGLTIPQSVLLRADEVIE